MPTCLGQPKGVISGEIHVFRLQGCEFWLSRPSAGLPGCAARHPRGQGLGGRRRGWRWGAAALEEAAQILVDRVGADDGALRGLLHIVVEAQVGQIHVRAHGLMRVIDAFAQLIGAGFDDVELGEEGTVEREFRHIDIRRDQVRVQVHLDGEGLHHAAALRADVRHAAFFLHAQVDEKGQLRLDGGKGCQDVRHVLRRD